MSVVEVASHDIADVIPVGYGGVPAALPVGVSGFMVTARVPGFACCLIRRADRERVAVDTIAVDIVHVAVVQVVLMPLVLDGGVSAAFAMRMAVPFVHPVLAYAHASSPRACAVSTHEPSAPPPGLRIPKDIWLAAGVSCAGPLTPSVRLPTAGPAPRQTSTPR